MAAFDKNYGAMDFTRKFGRKRKYLNKKVVNKIQLISMEAFAINLKNLHYGVYSKKYHNIYLQLFNRIKI